MQTVGAILRRPAPELTDAHDLLPHFGGVGLELEVEGMRSYPDVDGWRKETDGSLRNGMEYVFDGPAGGAQAVERIDAIVEAFRRRPPVPSFRCSTHIHMDVRDLRLDELERLVLVYMTLEDVMFDHCAAHRRWSNFCVPMFNNSGFARMFSTYRNYESGHGKIRQLQMWPKYSALNLKPVTEYGSVEFRGSHCMVTRDELIGLCQRMLHMKRLAKELVMPGTELVERLNTATIEELFPSGLSQGYLRSPEAAEDCYVNAMDAASAQWRYRDSTGDSDEDDFRPSSRSGRPAPARAERNDCAVRVRRAVLERYHLQAGGGAMMMSDLLRVLDALRSVQGMAAPTFTDVAMDAEQYVGSRILTNCASHIGIRLTPELLGQAWMQPTQDVEDDEEEDF